MHRRDVRHHQLATLLTSTKVNFYIEQQHEIVHRLYVSGRWCNQCPESGGYWGEFLTSLMRVLRNIFHSQLLVFHAAYGFLKFRMQWLCVSARHPFLNGSTPSTLPLKGALIWVAKMVSAFNTTPLVSRKRWDG